MYHQMLGKIAMGREGGSVSFTEAGTYQWTCPEGVYFVKSLVGIGGTGTNYTEWVSVSPYVRVTTTSGTDGTYDTLSYSTVQAKMASIVNTLNALPVGQSTFSSLDYTYYYGPNNKWFDDAGGSEFWRRQDTIGTNSTLDALSGDVPVPPSNTYYYPTGTIQKRRTRYDDGNDSTALGYTFAGDADEAEYAGIPVTPNQQYEIVVGDFSEYGGTSTEGSITITW